MIYSPASDLTTRKLLWISRKIDGSCLMNGWGETAVSVASYSKNVIRDQDK